MRVSGDYILLEVGGWGLYRMREFTFFILWETNEAAVTHAAGFRASCFGSGAAGFVGSDDGGV